MKVFMFHNLPPGGANRAFYTFAKYLAKNGCPVHIIYPSTAITEFSHLCSGAVVTKIPVVKTLSGIITSVRYVLPFGEYSVSLGDLERTHRLIANIINSSDCDAVFVEQDRFTYSPFLLRYLKKPHVYYCPQPYRADEAIIKKLQRQVSASPWKSIWRYYLRIVVAHIDRRNASFASLILTNSYFSRENILRVYGKNAFVSYLGVDTDVFKPLGLTRDSFILSVGGLGPSKGFDFIIRAISLIKEDARPRLVIVGNRASRSWEDYLKRLSEDKSVQLDVIIGITDEELVHLYNRAKLCVYAPYLEPFGLVPLEAMACGTPVVGVREGGVRETVIHGETGYLTERDEGEFAQAVETLLMDEAKRALMGKRSVDAVRNFWTMEHATQRLLKYLHRAANSVSGAAYE